MIYPPTLDKTKRHVLLVTSSIHDSPHHIRLFLRSSPASSMSSPFATAKMLSALASGRIDQARFDQQVAIRRAKSQSATNPPSRREPERSQRQPYSNAGRRFERAPPAARRSNRMQPRGDDRVRSSVAVTRPTQASVTTASTPACGIPGEDYFNCLVDAKSANPARLPDSYDRPTAVFRSINEYSAPVNTLTGDGRFSLCAQPIIGDVSQPTHYQLAMVDTSVVTDFRNADWTAATSYASASLEGSDPRIDFNAPAVTSPTAGHWAQNWVIATDPIDWNSLVAPVTAVSASPTNTNLQPLLWSSPGGSGGNALQLPPGNYSITLQVKMTPVTAAPPSGGIRLAMVQANGGVNWQPPAGRYPTLIDTFNPTTAVTVGVSANASATFSISVGARNNLFMVMVVDSVSGNSYTNAGVTASNINVSNAYFNGALPYTGSGLVEEIRPVAMSCMVSYFGPTLTDGGVIAGAFVPSDAVQSNFFGNNSNNPGQLQFAESVMKLDRSYNGRLSEGCRVIWVPYSPGDTDFRSVTDMNDYDWPAIVISGVYMPGTAPSVASNFTLRVELCVAFEVVSKATIFDLQTKPGSASTIDMVNNLIKPEQLARSNGSHWAWIRAMAAKAAAYYNKNKNVINPLMMAVGSTLL